MKHRTFIIAEAGVNHNGRYDIARKLILAAKKCGADAIKFQTYKAEQLVTEEAPKADYQKKNLKNSGSQLQMLKGLELKEEELEKLAAYAKNINIKFLSSPFDNDSCDFLVKLGVPIIKIPSGEITNYPFLTYIAKKKKEIILSTGMSNLGEVEQAIKTMNSAGNRRITLLHCVTEYPAPFNQINLLAMITLKNAFKLPVGYSDHTSGIEIPIAAVSLGAEVIEKHFTLDKNMIGPDHIASLDPYEFSAMVKAIRNVELALGDGIKQPARCELPNKKVVRRSIHSAKKLIKGQKICGSDLVLKRPGDGLSSGLLPLLIGKTIKKEIPSNTKIKFSDFE